MSLFNSPTSYRLLRQARNIQPPTTLAMTPAGEQPLAGALGGHQSHPDFGHLILLVFEAVLEVVCISLPGYIIARQGMFDAEAQKFLANLNVQLFTPCLIFTKLASQLTAEKFIELGIIPLIFVVQTLISFLCSLGVSKLFRFTKRQTNFVTAMGVFGNSNSLPISLVMSLSNTLSGLHWNRIPGDNDDEVAARGILYLLIFQQLGQLVRWSWGYHVLLAPASRYKDEQECQSARAEEGDASDAELRVALLDNISEEQRILHGKRDENGDFLKPKAADMPPDSDYGSGTATPLNREVYLSSACSSLSSISDALPDEGTLSSASPTPTNGSTTVGKAPGDVAELPVGNGAIAPSPGSEYCPSPSPGHPKGARGCWTRLRSRVGGTLASTAATIKRGAGAAFRALPQPAQVVLSKTGALVGRILSGLWAFMNPPLWAMLAAIIIASIPKLQQLFFNHGTFINNSVTRAVAQSGGVAVPLILVVLGANLARNTLPPESRQSLEDPKVERNLLIASLISRMLLPTLLMTPLLAVTAKYVPVSILDDPIFIIVCFLLTGAPSALQLAQICQLNNVYMGAITNLLFQSYVVWILPSTLVLVMLALAVVEWAK